jgi:hypothetical protein
MTNERTHKYGGHVSYILLSTLIAIGVLVMFLVGSPDQIEKLKDSAISGFALGASGFGFLVTYALVRRRLKRGGKPRVETAIPGSAATQPPTVKSTVAGFNPFRCKTNFMRRLSLLVSGVLSAAWVLWVGIDSRWFQEIQPVGLVIVVAIPVGIFALTVVAARLAHKTSRVVRYQISVNLLWVFVVGGWGYIFDWQNYLMFEQYVALLVLPPIGIWLGFFLWRWSRSVG